MTTSGASDDQLCVELQEGVEANRGWRFWRPIVSFVGQAALGSAPDVELPPPADVTGVRVVLVDPVTDEIVHASEWFAVP